MNKGWIAVILVGLSIAAATGVLGWRAGHASGLEKGRVQGGVFPREMLADRSSVSLTHDARGVHFGTLHVEHDLGDQALAMAVHDYLKSGQAFVELHDPRFGHPNAIHDAIHLTTLRDPPEHLVVEGVRSIAASTVEGSPRLSITDDDGKVFRLDFLDSSQVPRVLEGLNRFLFAAPAAASTVRLDLVITKANMTAEGYRWALVRLMLLRNPARMDECGDHAVVLPATLAPEAPVALDPPAP